MSVADHYARRGLVAAIEEGVLALGKTPRTVTLDDLAAVDEFHIGGRAATAALMQQLHLDARDYVLDIGCGLGGPARFAAYEYRCRVTGIDLTKDYVEAGTALTRWVGLERYVSLSVANALRIPFADGMFSAAYMVHAGMNIADKNVLCSEIARVLKKGALFAIYDVMRTAEGELVFPVPWATNSAGSAVAGPGDYKAALRSAGFAILGERDRRDFAQEHFAQQRTKISASSGPPPLGLQTLMGERRQLQVRNMIYNISAGKIAPVEIIARKE
jgi:ubiquinone/menaquinone biosynthesis C-methylase UbiE